MTSFFNYVLFIVIFPNAGVWDFSMANVDRDIIWYFIRWARMAIRWSRSRVMCMLHAHSRGQLGKEWKYKVTFVFVFCFFLKKFYGKKNENCLTYEWVCSERDRCLQSSNSSKWKKPKQGRASQAIHDIFVIPSSGVHCILSNLPFYFYLFWVWVLNHYPHYFSIKKKSLLFSINVCTL